MDTSNTINYILESILELDLKSRKQPAVSELVTQCLAIYDSLPDSLFASLHLVDVETFEIEHQETVPANEITRSLELYECLLDKGFVGDVLSSGCLQICEPYSRHDCCVLMSPLISSEGVLGFTVVEFRKLKDAFEKDLLSAIGMLSSSLSHIITNHRLKFKLANTLATIDQQVASRTITLVESKRNLVDKFEKFRSSVSMSMPHEARTPLNHILGLTDYLISSTGPVESEEHKELLCDIYQAAERLHRHFENYLFYNQLNLVASRIEELQKIKEDVTHLSSETIQSLVRQQFEKHHRADEIRLDCVGVSVAVSEEYVRKIFEELIDNSIKYSEPSSVFTITSKIKKGFLCLSFTDKGRGMTPEQVRGIEAFMQFDREVYEQQGTGLGMAIVGRIVDIYKGVLDIDSNPGEYTTVTVSLPLVESAF